MSRAFDCSASQCCGARKAFDLADLLGIDCQLAEDTVIVAADTESLASASKRPVVANAKSNTYPTCKKRRPGEIDLS